MSKSICYILIGFPGSGKSYWASQVCHTVRVFSTDQIIDDICNSYQVSYDFGWSKLIDFANAIYNREIDDFLDDNEGNDVVFDRTNLTRSARKKIIDKFKGDYQIEAITFTVDEDVRKERCANRPGKKIPYHVIERMKLSYVPFHTDELL